VLDLDGETGPETMSLGAFRGPRMFEDLGSIFSTAKIDAYVFDLTTVSQYETCTSLGTLK
jgi:hypothetical protein